MPARTKPLKSSAPQAEGARAKRFIKDPKRRLAKVVELLEANLGAISWEGKRDGLTVLVLTILSQNTTDGNALKGFTRLCERFPNPDSTELLRDPNAIPRNEDGSVDAVKIRLSQAADAFFSPDWHAIENASEKEVKEAIRVAGLPNSKAPAIKRVLEWLSRLDVGFHLEKAISIDDPVRAVEQMAAIKGVGEKTASVTLIEAYGADLCPVDTHVHRVVHRLEVIEKTQDRNKTYRELQKVVPKGKGYQLHHHLLTFGRTTCNARAPKCDECFLAALCPEGRERRTQ